jgi:metal-responsive CopG/Arc/MetJ family transcriptional regulator
MISAIDHLAAQGLTSRSSVIRSMLLAQLQAKGIATLADRVPA